MSVSVPEGDKRLIRARVERLTGAGAITLTSPERRILNASRALVAGFDWAPATWDGTLNELSALFDSTQVGLTATGTYYMDLRGTIGQERYTKEIQVDVVEIGP